MLSGGKDIHCWQEKKVFWVSDIRRLLNMIKPNTRLLAEIGLMIQTRMVMRQRRNRYGSRQTTSQSVTGQEKSNSDNFTVYRLLPSLDINWKFYSLCLEEPEGCGEVTVFNF